MKAITSQFVVLLSSLRVVKASVPTGRLLSIFLRSFSLIIPPRLAGLCFCLFCLSVILSVSRIGLTRDCGNGRRATDDRLEVTEFW